MAVPIENSLEELLAEPMVKLLMHRDGVSISDARSLYDAVAPRLRRPVTNLSTTDEPNPCALAKGSSGELPECI